MFNLGIVSIYRSSLVDEDNINGSQGWKYEGDNMITKERTWD